MRMAINKTAYSNNFLDPQWRITNLYKIIDKNSQLRLFNPNPIQQIINASSAKRSLILKSRQQGITTNEVIKRFDQMVFTRNFTACIMAHEADAIQKIFRIARRSYSSMPDGLKPNIDKGGGSMYQMRFPDIGSQIYCDLESRGDTISHLHVSEGAFVEYERFISTMQAVPLSGSVTIESTPNGVGNWFYDMWHEDNGYKKFFFPWFLDPNYKIDGPSITRTTEERALAKYALKQFGIKLSDSQLRFRRAKQLELKDFFLQEYPEDPETCFLLSGGMVVDRAIITELIKLVAEPIEKTDTVKIFKKFSNHGNYVIGADTAQGIGKDWSVGVCIDVTTREEVGMIRGKLSPFQFANALVEFAHIFSRGSKLPLIAVESNNHGHAVLQELYEHKHYPRLYRCKNDTLGWATNSVTRPIMMNQCITAVTEETVKINSKEILQEMLTLVNKNGKIEAATGRNDDTVIALGIAVQIMSIESAKADLYKNPRAAIMV
jgi:hypothetical protein